MIFLRLVSTLPQSKSSSIMSSIFVSLPVVLLVRLLTDMLMTDDVGKLDTSTTNESDRKVLLCCMRHPGFAVPICDCDRCTAMNFKHLQKWLILRRVKPSTWSISFNQTDVIDLEKVNTLNCKKITNDAYIDTDNVFLSFENYTKKLILFLTQHKSITSIQNVLYPSEKVLMACIHRPHLQSLSIKVDVFEKEMVNYLYETKFVFKDLTIRVQNHKCMSLAMSFKLWFSQSFKYDKYAVIMLYTLSDFKFTTSDNVTAIVHIKRCRVAKEIEILLEQFEESQFKRLEIFWEDVQVSHRERGGCYELDLLPIGTNVVGQTITIKSKDTPYSSYFATYVHAHVIIHART